MGVVIKILSLVYRFVFGGSLLGKIAMWGGIAVVSMVGLKAFDWINDSAAVEKHEAKKTKYVRKKVKNARRAARGVRTNSDVRRVLEKAARGN